MILSTNLDDIEVFGNEIQLEAETADRERVENHAAIEVERTSTKYSITLKGAIVEDIDQITAYIKERGEDRLDVRVGDQIRDLWGDGPIHRDILGVQDYNGGYEFIDIIYDTKGPMIVQTAAAHEGNPLESNGYTVVALENVSNGNPDDAYLFLETKDRSIAEAVHNEVLEAFENLHFTAGVKSAETQALEHVIENSRFKDCMKINYTIGRK